MIGVEVEQGQVTAQRDLATAERAGQPAAVLAVAGPATAQLPEAGPGRVRRAQPGQVGDHHFDAGRAQGIEMRGRHAAVKRVDGIGDQHRLQAGNGALALDQGAGELRAERAQGRRGVGAGKIVEQEHVHHDHPACLSDQAQCLIENMLVAMADAGSVEVGDIGQQGHRAGGPQREFLADTFRQGFPDLVHGHCQIARQQHQQDRLNQARERRFSGFGVETMASLKVHSLRQDRTDPCRLAGYPTGYWGMRGRMAGTLTVHGGHP